jgi:CubicO group peptidase (beta-lactamase class C family)
MLEWEERSKDMKINRKKKALLWGTAAIALVGLGVLAWFLIPGLHAPVAAPVAEYWPTDGWRTSTPEEQGFDSVKLAEGLQALQEGHIAIDSLLIIRNGYVVLDASFYPYDESFPHNLASVTKSVTTTLIAIAAEQGKLRLDQPMVSYFPDRTIANLDDRKKSITVRHLAGMVNGMKSGCLAGDEPTLDAMRSTSDWVQAALDREMVDEPGKNFCYDSPGMHLLSAILQETTGMTELEFAQQNLFEPLGIQEVFWESDPQGFTHGWGDLHLKPRDAAKLGYLWLNRGVWEGKQIVPSAWVADAVKVHSQTGVKDNYGYGWWVSDDSYFALGRGGQHVKVYPTVNAIVVTTARSFDYATIDPILAAAFISPDKPLPTNPEGVAKLNALLAKLVQGAATQPAAALPEIAKTVSGKTYVCESNPAGVTSLRFEFDDPAIARLFMEQNNKDVVWPIGLDGKYRMSPEGQGLRGYWQDSQTFILEVFDVGQPTRKLHFDGNQLQVSLSEINLTFTCQVQNP